MFRRWSRFGSLLSSFCRGGARLEAEAVVAGFDDMAVMRQAIEQCGRHFRIAEHAGPLAEAQVRCDDHAGALIELAEQGEKQGSTRRAKGQITKLVQDHEVASGEPLGDLAGLSQGFLLLERIDQFDRREEANLFAVMFDGLNAESRRQMRLSGSGASDEDDIVGLVDELAPMELSHQRFVDLARGKIESGQILVSGEARRLD